MDRRKKIKDKSKNIKTTVKSNRSGRVTKGTVKTGKHSSTTTKIKTKKSGKVKVVKTKREGDTFTRNVTVTNKKGETRTRKGVFTGGNPSPFREEGPMNENPGRPVRNTQKMSTTPIPRVNKSKTKMNRSHKRR